MRFCIAWIIGSSDRPIAQANCFLPFPRVGVPVGQTTSAAPVAAPLEEAAGDAGDASADAAADEAVDGAVEAADAGADDGVAAVPEHAATNTEMTTMADAARVT